MKSACAIGICLLALLFSACVTGDEITSFVIDQNGSISVAIYRVNLTSNEKGEKAKEELAGYLKNLREKRDNIFTKFRKANATDVKVAVLRKTSPASALITCRIPALDDFAAYASEADTDGTLVCKAISNERTRSLVFEITQKPNQEKPRTESTQSRADSFEETRFALAEGEFTSARGFIISEDKRSALLDMDGLTKMQNSGTSTITLSLEWQIPQAR